MLTLPPPQTIQTPVAPTNPQAQPPRSGRTDSANRPESTSFGSALSSADDSHNKAQGSESEHSNGSPHRVDSKEAEAAGTNHGHGVETEETPESATQDDQIDSEKEFTEDVNTPIVGLAGAATVDTARTPSIASTVPTQEQGPESTGQSDSQRFEPAGQSIQSPDGELSTILDETGASTPSKDAQPAIIPQSIAPAPQQNVEPSVSAVDATIEGQAAALDVPSEFGSTTGDEQRQPGHPSAGVSDPTINSASTDPAAAQSLRQVSVEPAPIVLDPVSVDSQISPQTSGPQGARPGAVQQTTQSPSLGAVEPDQAFSAAVGRGLAAAVRQQGGTLTIKLDPPTLGKLTIRMTIEQGKVEATFDAQTAQARDLLLEHATTLRAKLRDRGLTVERLEIVGATSAGKSGHSSSGTGDNHGADGEQDAQHHDAAGGQNRGRSETGEEQPSTDDGASGDTAGTAGEPPTSPFEAQLRYSVSAIA